MPRISPERRTLAHPRADGRTLRADAATGSSRRWPKCGTNASGLSPPQVCRWGERARIDSGKRTSATLTDLEQAGLIVFGLDSRGQRAGVKLSPLGDTVARTLVADTTLAGGWPLFESMADLAERADWRLLPEHLFCGIADWCATPYDEAILEIKSAAI